MNIVKWSRWTHHNFSSTSLIWSLLWWVWARKLQIVHVITIGRPLLCLPLAFFYSWRHLLPMPCLPPLPIYGSSTLLIDILLLVVTLNFSVNTHGVAKCVSSRKAARPLHTHRQRQTRVPCSTSAWLMLFLLVCRPSRLPNSIWHRHCILEGIHSYF